MPRASRCTLVYRRVLLEDMGARAARPVAAARDGRVALVNPFRSRVANNKKLFALLEDPRFAHLVEPRRARRDPRHDPVDARPPPRAAPTYGELGGRPAPVRRPTTASGSCSSRRPTTAAHGVALGIETEQADWDAIIDAHADRADYVVQEYVPVPEEMFPTVEDGHVQMRLKRFNINPFGIGGRYAG